MKKENIKKTGLILGLGLMFAIGIVVYLFNMPKRDVQAIDPDFKVDATNLVDEYLKDENAANAKYLATNGESKIIQVSGTIVSITEDLNHQKVLLLKELNESAGVSCTFSPKASLHLSNLKIGDQATIKGVIRSGASFDEDLEMYEHVILEKCDINN